MKQQIDISAQVDAWFNAHGAWAADDVVRFVDQLFERLPCAADTEYARSVIGRAPSLAETEQAAVRRPIRKPIERTAQEVEKALATYQIVVEDSVTTLQAKNFQAISLAAAMEQAEGEEPTDRNGWEEIGQTSYCEVRDDLCKRVAGKVPLAPPSISIASVK